MEWFRLVLVSCLAGAALTASGQFEFSPSIGEAEPVASFYMERPSLATDSLGQPHLVCDGGGDTRFMKFHKVNGQWTGGIFAVGSRSGRYSASRLYVGQIEIDSRDRAWISCKFGVKEYGSMYGQGIWLFRNVSTTPNPPESFFRFVCVYKGMGVVTTDSKYPDQGVVIGTFGNYAILYSDGRTLATGSLNGGPGGEKVRARIASYAPRFGAESGASYEDGVWHTAMNGYSAASSRYQNLLRYKAGLGPVEWAAYGAYPQQGSDFSHPGIGIDLLNPALCYIGSVFNGRLCINIWNGSAMTYNTSSLKVLDFGATYEVRHGPAFAPSPAGGTFIFWTSGGRIKMAYLSQDGNVTPPVDVTAGRSPAATLDRFGNIHLAYYSGGIQYRKILIAALDPWRPSGRVASTRQPEFAWSDSRTNAYTLELTLDGTPFPPLTVSTSSWTPPVDFPAGVYAWRVKEGEADSTRPWSRPLAFTIPPAMPVPVSPVQRITDVPYAGPIEWACPDPGVQYARIELYKGADCLDRWSTTGKTTVLTNALDAGDYAWRVKAFHSENGFQVGSDWSALQPFQVGVPGACQIISPDMLAEVGPGAQSISCSWTEAEGASHYNLTLLHNGAWLAGADAITATSHTFTRKFKPGYHTLIVQPVNSDGPGPASPARTFIVNRNMVPGANTLLSAPLPAFTWTRSKSATRYLFKLARFDDAAAKYKVVFEAWPLQGKSNPMSCSPAYSFPAGRYRWTVTDYAGATPGFTSIDFFEVQDLP